MSKIMAICNQKGGVGKTFTTVSLGIGLARMGKRVLVADIDAQGSLTASLGYQHPDQIENTLATVLGHIITDEPLIPGEGIIHHEEGIDLLPANIELSGLEVTLVNTMSRETVLRKYLNSIRDQYDVILLDCCPSLGMLTLNALAAADEVLVPMQAHYLSVKGFVSLNTFEIKPIEINRYDAEGQLIEEYAGVVAFNGGISKDGGFSAHLLQDYDRGYATGSMDFYDDEVLDISKLAGFLCTDCLNEILPRQADRCFGVGAVNLATKKVRIFTESLSGFTLGDFYIDCDLRDQDGGKRRMGLLIFYCPLRYEQAP